MDALRKKQAHQYALERQRLETARHSYALRAQANSAFSTMEGICDHWPVEKLGDVEELISLAVLHSGLHALTDSE